MAEIAAKSGEVPPIGLARTTQWAVPGRTDLSVLVSWPEAPPPPKGYPALFLLDGGLFFGMASDAAALFAIRADVSGVAPGLIVAIAHGRDTGGLSGPARIFDFTPPLDPRTLPPRPNGAAWPALGGAQAFRGLLAALIAQLTQTFPLDANRLTLFGHSLAGRFVVETAVEAPHLFVNAVAASPSLWLGGPVEIEAARLATALPDDPARRIVLYAGSKEAEPAPDADPDRAERQARNRIVFNAAATAALLDRVAPGRLSARFTLLEGEDHVSGLPHIVGRAVSLAFQQSTRSGA